MKARKLISMGLAILFFALAYVYHHYLSNSAIAVGKVCVERLSLYSECIRYVFGNDERFSEAVAEHAKWPAGAVASLGVFVLVNEILAVILVFFKRNKK